METRVIHVWESEQYFSNRLQMLQLVTVEAKEDGAKSVEETVQTGRA